MLNRDVALRVGTPNQHCMSNIDTLLQGYNGWNDSSHLEVLDTVSKSSDAKPPLSWSLMMS